MNTENRRYTIRHQFNSFIDCIALHSTTSHCWAMNIERFKFMSESSYSEFKRERWTGGGCDLLSHINIYRVTSC